ncbi:uncharacterized protein LOC114538005 [Dendronephthya gigantea]|uniref:uncharacterized protein LOC114538005 n=1 Tax=Dendronephthya gigantea TaxID=151771 RepID=UPI00106C9E67|nr:uncharacterized protein LOC114538005 [Dendronephthya gigantea]
MPLTCSDADWWGSFDIPLIWSKCGAKNLLITGFYRSPLKGGSDSISLLEEARCCNSIPGYSGQNGQCKEASWWSSFDKFMFLLLIFLYLQPFVHGYDFCFDGSNEGYRLNAEPIEIIHAESGPECAMKCAAKNGCRSVNFKKQRSCEEIQNCQLLTEVYSEKSPEQLTEDEEYDYYILVDCNGKPLDPTPANSTTPQQSTTCSHVDWSQSVDSMGWSKCGEENLFITGLYRGPPNSDSDPITLLEKAKCCKAIPKASCKACSGQNSQCQIADWWSSFDTNNKSSVCPVGYFLNGLYRNADGDDVLHELHRIEQGYCCKPNNHPNRYGLCYDEDVGTSFNQEGWSNCSKAGYYITGLYRGYGDNWLNNIDKFRCCQTA